MLTRFVSVNGEASTLFRIFFFFFRIRIMIRIRFSLWNSFKKVILYILKIPTKFAVAPQSFCKNQNSVQDQDQDHDFTLDFNTRPTFHTWKTPTKFCLDSLTPSKVIVSTAKVHVLSDRQTDRRTDIFFLIEPKSYTAMVLYLYFDSLLSTCPKKNGNWKMAQGCRLSLTDNCSRWIFEQLSSFKV